MTGKSDFEWSPPPSSPHNKRDDMSIGPYVKAPTSNKNKAIEIDRHFRFYENNIGSSTSHISGVYKYQHCFIKALRDF